MRALVLAAVLAGCSTGAPDSAQPDLPTPDPASSEVGPFEDEADFRRQRGATEAALEAATTPATATDVGACRVVATSEQACGGPASFAVYSAEASDVAEVERLAARLVALDKVANAQFERMSTCQAYTPPTPVLRGGECAPSDG